MIDFREAAAITLPDNSSCSTTGTNGCFRISNTSTNSAAQAIKAETTGNGTALTGTTATTGTGVKGVTATGTGVLGTATSGVGVSGTASSGAGSGVSGTASSTSGSGNGIQGTASGTGIGVKGVANNAGAGTAGFLSSQFAGVYGSSTRGYGVYGATTADSLAMAGVLGYTTAPFSFGLMGVYQGGDNQMAGVFGKAIIPGGGEYDFDPVAVGVLGISGGAGIRGQSVTAPGVPGTGAQPGVDGFSDLGWGVSGYSYATTGACAWPGTCDPWNGAVGVRGESLATSQGSGVLGVIQSTADANSAAVRGIAAGGLGKGVWGVSGSGVAVQGVSVTGNGIVGYNSVTDHSAAAISAIPGSTSGLAYWGGGGIALASSFAEKTGGGSWSAPSDRRIKKDVKDLDRGLAELMRVRPVRFKYNGLGGTEDDGKEYVGVIAQELEQVVPSMVSTRKGKLHKDDAKEAEIAIVDPSAFTYMLINSVKQQQKTIQKQEARIAELERRSAPLASSVVPSSLAGWLALGLLPIGIVLGRRRQNRRE